MPRQLSLRWFVVAGLCSGALIAACSNDVASISTKPLTPPSDTVPRRAVVDSIRVVLINAGVYAGDTTRFIATAYDSAAHVIPDAVITWRSSDTSIATVDGNGLATARQRGVVDVTATSAGISKQATLVVSPILSMAPGDSISFTSFYRLPTKVRLSLRAGDTVDLGGWVRGDTFAFPLIGWDPATTSTALEATVGYTDEHAGRGIILPGLVANVAGSYVFRVETAIVAGPCNILRIQDCTVPTTVEVRRSGPSIPRVGFTARGTEGTIVNDSLVVRNAGAGDVTISVAHVPSWMTVQPSSATIHGKQAQRFALRAEAAPPGIRTDSIVFSGLPSDRWSPVWRAVPVTVRLDNRDTVLTTTTDLVSLTFTATNTLVAAGWTPGALYTIDKSSGRAEPLSDGLIQSTTNIPQLTSGGDGTLYVAQPLASETRLWRLTETKSLENFATLRNVSTFSYAVMADRTLYYSTGANQENTIFWQALVDSTLKGTISAGATPRPNRILVVDGVALSPIDHKLYYTVLGISATSSAPGELHVLDPATKTTAYLGPVLGRIVAIDKRGYIYTIGTGSIINQITTVSVYDSTGKLLDTRWPSLDISTLAVDEDWIYGIVKMKRSILKMPVRTY